MTTIHRYVVLGLLVAVGLAASATGQQPKFHKLQGGLTHGVYFVDSSRGWCCGDGGLIEYTTDGGFTWTAATFQDEETNEAIRVPLQGIFVQPVPGSQTEVRGWAVGENGVVLKTVPGFAGQFWQDANPTSRVTDNRSAPLPCYQNLANLWNIYMNSDGLTGWVVGIDGALRKTVDGGATWFYPFAVPPAMDPFLCDENPEDVYDVHFFADSSPEAPYSRGVIASEYNHIYTTTDSGATWTPIDVVAEVGGSICPNQTGANLELWALDFENPQLSTSPGWLVGGIGTSRGYIFRTSNGGVEGSWTQTKCYDLLPGPPVCGLATFYALAALSSSDPMAVTGGYAAVMFDYRAGTADLDPCMAPCGPGIPNPCGAGTPTWVQRETAPVIPDPCDHKPPIFGGARISSTAALFSGSFGRKQRYANGTVTDVGTTDFTRLKDGKFIDELTGCVTGQGRIIKRTTDGGVTWTTVNTWACSDNDNCNAIDFTSFTPIGGQPSGVTVGTGGFIAWSGNGGQDWTQVASVPTSADLNDVTWANTADFGCPALGRAIAVSSNGLVLVSDDFAHTWCASGTAGCPMSTPGAPGLPLYGVSFAGTCTGYVCGASGKVYKTTDGGQSWTAVPIVGGSTDTFYDIQTWGNGTNAIMVGQNGSVYETSGGRFYKQTLPFNPAVTDHLRDVEVLNNGLVVRISGEQGTALFRDSGTWSKVRSQTNGQLWRMSFQSATHGFGIGQNFVITKYASAP